MVLKNYEYKGVSFTWEKSASQYGVSNGALGLESFRFYCNGESFLTLDEVKRYIDTN